MSTKLSVPHNWQNDLIDNLDMSCVEEFYGKLDSDVLGGGRPSNTCAPVSRKTIAREIRRIHALGKKFNYLLNATCLDNRELTRSMHARLSKLLDWLDRLEVDAVTVSLPYLFNYVRKNFPRFKINVSAMTQVSSVDEAKFWEDLGASRITLCNVKVNRDLALLAKIRGAVKCQLQVIVNNGCLCHCPFAIPHALVVSHASQKGHLSGGFLIDYYRLMCSSMRLRQPVNFIRSDWIRPEDLVHYHKAGADYAKIVDRGMTTRALERIVKVYTLGYYKGNLMDLLPTPSKSINFSKRSVFFIFKYFFRPHLVNIFKLLKMKERIEEDTVYIDNQKLDGFLVALQRQECGSKDCKKCSWCNEIADNAVKVDPIKAESALNALHGLLDDFESGTLFN